MKDKRPVPRVLSTLQIQTRVGVRISAGSALPRSAIDYSELVKTALTVVVVVAAAAAAAGDGGGSGSGSGHSAAAAAAGPAAGPTCSSLASSVRDCHRCVADRG